MVTRRGVPALMPLKIACGSWSQSACASPPVVIATRRCPRGRTGDNGHVCSRHPHLNLEGSSVRLGGTEDGACRQVCDKSRGAYITAGRNGASKGASAPGPEGDEGLGSAAFMTYKFPLASDL